MLTRKQFEALEKYEDGSAHNERALRIHETVYANLTKKGFLKRAYFLQSTITDAGLAALKSYREKA